MCGREENESRDLRGEDVACCPFCASDMLELTNSRMVYYVFCHDCGSCGPQMSNGDLAVVRWNWSRDDNNSL